MVKKLDIDPSRPGMSIGVPPVTKLGRKYIDWPWVIEQARQVWERSADKEATWVKLDTLFSEVQAYRLNSGQVQGFDNTKAVATSRVDPESGRYHVHVKWKGGTS